MNALIMCAIAVSIFAVGLVIWGLFAFEAYKKGLAVEIISGKPLANIAVQPSSIQQFRSEPNRKTLMQYHRLLDEFEKLAVIGKVPTTSTEVAQLRLSVTSLYSVLYKKEYRSRSLIAGLAIFILLPLSFWVLIVAGLLWALGQGITEKNLMRFETLMTSYYQTPVPTTSQTTATSVESIIELGKLRQQDLISEDEFTRLKNAAIKTS